MSDNLSTDPPLTWRNLAQLHAYYLEELAELEGRAVTEVVDECLEQRAFETYCFQSTGAQPNDRPDYERNIKVLDDRIKAIHGAVRKLMLDDAADGKWVAFGRRHPDSNLEAIPSRYWPFLVLDLQNEVATGEGMTFRQLRCLIMQEIPVGHPIRRLIRAAQQLPRSVAPPIQATKPNELVLLEEASRNDGAGAPKGTGQDPGATAVEPSVRPPASASPPHPLPEPKSVPAPPLPTTGAPGRPSNMHFIVLEFERRRAADQLESSLRQEARTLEAWFKVNYPTQQPVTAKTIANRLRSKFREAQSKQA